MKNTQPTELLPPENQLHHQPSHALAARDQQPVDVARPQPTPAEMMQEMIQRGVTQENAAAFKELVLLSEHMEDRKAIRTFNSAFTAMQSELPVIVASTVIPNRGKYEKFEDVMNVVGPILKRHNFSVAFSQDFKENRIIITCKLKHDCGHFETNSYATRVSGKADSETQADSKASTTAKRNALLQALNIVIRQDCLNEEHDASMEGGNITDAQAGELERRVAETNSNKEAFLKVAGATSYATIPAGKYVVLDGMLRRKENPKY